MIDKKIKNRIAKLEALYPSEYVNVEEHTKVVIDMLENALGHKLTINLPHKKYFDNKTLGIDIYRLLPIEDLRRLAYGNTKTRKENL